MVSPSPVSRGLSFQDGGSGMRRPMGRWNFLRRGSTVTMGLKVAWFPSSLVTSSSGTGCAWGQHQHGHQGQVPPGCGTAWAFCLPLPAGAWLGPGPDSLGLTCRASLTFLVTAASGKVACTMGTSVLFKHPPSGGIRSQSWQIRDMTTK